MIAFGKGLVIVGGFLCLTIVGLPAGLVLILLGLAFILTGRSGRPNVVVVNRQLDADGHSESEYVVPPGEKEVSWGRVMFHIVMWVLGIGFLINHAVNDPPKARAPTAQVQTESDGPQKCVAWDDRGCIKREPVR